MKKLILIFICHLSINAYSQTYYSIGFEDGYKIGYCYNIGVGCVPPIVPITPITRVGESSGNYFDGYNRGLLMGSELSIKANNSEALKQQQSMAVYGNQTYVPKLIQFKPDYNFYMNALAQNQENYEKKKDEKIIDDALDEKLKAYVAEYSDPKNVKTRINLINFAKLYYSELRVYPKTIMDGKHIVTRTPKITNNNDSHYDDKVEVYVLNNKIIYIKELNDINDTYDIEFSEDELPNYKTKKDGVTFLFRSPLEIKNGMCEITSTIYFNYKGTYDGTSTFNIYFFDYILEYQEIQNKIKKAKNNYAKLTAFKKPTNGLHIAYIHNNEDRFDQVNILVENGKIIKYFNSEGKERIVVSGGEIIKNKSSISVTFTYADGSHPKLFFFEVLLL